MSNARRSRSVTALGRRLLESSWRSGRPLTAGARGFRLGASRGERKRLGGESLGTFAPSSQPAGPQLESSALRVLPVAGRLARRPLASQVQGRQ